MDLITITQGILTIIGGASVLLGVIAPLTKTKKDDKVLSLLLKILSFSSLHVEDKLLKKK